MIYLPTWMVNVYGFHVGKYTIPMDPLWVWKFGEMGVDRKKNRWKIRWNILGCFFCPSRGVFQVDLGSVFTTENHLLPVCLWQNFRGFWDGLWDGVGGWEMQTHPEVINIWSNLVGRVKIKNLWSETNKTIAHIGFPWNDWLVSFTYIHEFGWFLLE